VVKTHIWSTLDDQAAVSKTDEEESKDQTEQESVQIGTNDDPPDKQE
jgi:hypothetical protein